MEEIYFTAKAIVDNGFVRELVVSRPVDGESSKVQVLMPTADGGLVAEQLAADAEPRPGIPFPRPAVTR